MAAGVVTAIGFWAWGSSLPRADGQRRHHRRRPVGHCWGGHRRGGGLYVTGGVATVLIVLFQVILHRSSPLVKTQRTGHRCPGTERGGERSGGGAPPAGGAGVRRGGVRVTRLADGRAEVKCDALPAGYTAEDILRTLKGMPAIRSVEMHHPG